MNNQVDLKSAERRVVRLAFQDGLWEILLGLMILALALAAILRDALGLPWIYLPLIVVFTLGVPAMRAAKRKLSLPRTGHVHFNQPRMARFKSTNRVLVSLVIFTALFALLPLFIKDGGALPYWMVDAFFGLLTFGFFVYLAQTMETPRLIAYGLMLGLSMPLDVILQAETSITMPVMNILTGGVIVVWSCLVLYRFLQDFPLPEEVTPSEGSHVNR